MLKKIAKKCAERLPSLWLRALRRRYYLGIIKNYSESDWEWSGVIKPLIQPGSQVLDIGANVGYLSGLFARWVGPTGRVLSVEPIPATYDVLSSSMATLFPKTVCSLSCCVSDKSGEVTMAVPEYTEGGRNYYESHIVTGTSGSERNEFKVKATTMNELLAQHHLHPAVIKIDVEGHELAVIKGGEEYLTRHHPPLLIEVAGDPDEAGSPAARLFSTLDGWGYSPMLIKNGILQTRKAGDKSIDYFFRING